MMVLMTRVVERRPIHYAACCGDRRSDLQQAILVADFQAQNVRKSIENYVLTGIQEVTMD